MPRSPVGWSINGLSIELKLDRRTVRKRLQDVEPLSDGPKGPLYSLADAARALFGQPALSQVEDLNQQILRNKLAASEIDLARKRGEFMPRKEVERADDYLPILKQNLEHASRVSPSGPVADILFITTVPAQ